MAETLALMFMERARANPDIVMQYSKDSNNVFQPTTYRELVQEVGAVAAGDDCLVCAAAEVAQRLVHAHRAHHQVLHQLVAQVGAHQDLSLIPISEPTRPY